MNYLFWLIGVIVVVIAVSAFSGSGDRSRDRVRSPEASDARRPFILAG